MKFTATDHYFLSTYIEWIYCFRSLIGILSFNVRTICRSLLVHPQPLTSAVKSGISLSAQNSWLGVFFLCMSRKCHILKGILEQNMFYSSLDGMSSSMQLTEFKYNHWCYHFALFQINSLVVIISLSSWPANCCHSWETFLFFKACEPLFVTPIQKSIGSKHVFLGIFLCLLFHIGHEHVWWPSHGLRTRQGKEKKIFII